MQLYGYLLLFGSVLTGGLSFFLFKGADKNYLKLFLSFSGAFLFALSVLHLMPEVYSSPNKHIGAFILFGFFIQIVLEFFSEGIEHGHTHVHHDHLHAFPLAMILSLCLHSFLEGMPLAGATHIEGQPIDNSLLYGIVLHHLPVAFALVSMLIASGITRGRAVLFLCLFAIMGPLGAFTASMLGTGALNLSAWYNEIMAVVIGIFLHISTTILFESSSNHRFNLYKIAAILTGGILGILAT